MAADRMTWEAQHLCIMVKPCDDGRIVLEISTLEAGLDRRIYFTAQEWESFKATADHQMRIAQRYV
jgi:hypothetical protein